MNALTTEDHASPGEIVAFAKFKPVTGDHLNVRIHEKEAAMICEMHRRAREAEEIRAAAPTHTGLTPRTLREAFPHEAEPVLYLDNSLLAKCLRAFSRLFGRT